MPLAYYGSKISPNITKTPEGYLICHDVPINRIGVYKYLGCEIGRDGADMDREFDILRQPGEVFDDATLASFEGKPITDGHPPEDVTPDNIGSFSRGHAQSVRKGAGKYQGQTIADLYITDSQLIGDVMNGKREISCGYTYVLSQNKNGTLEQRSIRGNHIAVVEKGRAGSRVAIHDEQPERGKTMSKTHDGGFFGKLFKIAAKDDSMTVDDMEKLAKLSAADEGANLVDPNPVEGQQHNGTDEGDDLKQMFAAILTELKSLKSTEAAEDEGDDLEGIGSKEDPSEEKETQFGEDEPEDQENEVTVSPEEVGKSATDSARAIAQEMRTILKKNIPDPVAYKSAAKDAAAAIRKEFGIGTSNVGYQKFAHATAEAAKKRASRDAAVSTQKQCEDMQSAYNALNPHHKEAK